MAKQTKNSGQFQKGNNANPLGRAAPIAKAASAAGSDGVIAYGGYLSTGERNPRLLGRRKWVEYANSYRRPPVALAAMLRSALFAGVKWSLAENEAGGADARKGVDIVQRGLIDARMPKPWSAVVCKAQMSYFEGFSLHAGALARRPDGLVTYTEISERPAYTIEKWLRKSPTDPFTSVQQRLDTGETYLIDLDECFYCVNDTLTASPEGVGVLRLVVDRLSRVADYESLEGSELFSGMGGTPIARVPLEELGIGIQGTDAEVKAKKKAKTASIEQIVSDRIKTPEKRQYVVLDSKTYQGSDPNTISSIKKWDIEILKAELAGLVEIRSIITDEDLNIARMLGVDFAFTRSGSLIGGGATHESQVSLFAAQLTADSQRYGDNATQQLARRLVAANGLDPDTATPTMMPSPISTQDVLKTTQALVQLNMAGLARNHPAKIAIFDQMNLPWQDEPEPVLPRAPIAPLPIKPGPADPNEPAPAGDADPADRTEPDPENVNPKDTP